jgi:hypothetical protein
LVYVGDLPFRADRHQGIETCLDETARILRRSLQLRRALGHALLQLLVQPAQHFLGLLAIGDVVGYPDQAGDASLMIAIRRFAGQEEEPGPVGLSGILRQLPSDGCHDSPVVSMMGGHLPDYHRILRLSFRWRLRRSCL